MIYKHAQCSVEAESCFMIQLLASTDNMGSLKLML